MIRNDIIRFRATHNINQEQLSEMLGGTIGAKYISAFERGRLKISDEFESLFTALLEKLGIDETLPHDMEQYRKPTVGRRGKRRTRAEIEADNKLKEPKRKRRTKAEMAELRKNAVKVGQSLVEKEEQVKETITVNNELRLNEMLAIEIEKKLAQKEQEQLRKQEEERIRQLQEENQNNLRRFQEALQEKEREIERLAEQKEQEKYRNIQQTNIELEDRRYQEEQRLMEEQRIKSLVEARLKAYDEAERLKRSLMQEEIFKETSQIANTIEEPQTEIIDLPPKSKHYHNGNIDVIKFAEENTEALESLGFYRISALKYITRYGKKDGFNNDDLDKAIFYIDKMKEITSKGGM